jgi:N-acetylmuramoyl-L-alanine amidase
MRWLPNSRTGVAGHAVMSLWLVAAAPLKADSYPVAASRFEPGSCVLFTPTDGNRHLRVFIDAGHGGIDPGATGRTSSGQTVSEAPLNLLVAKDAAALLRGIDEDSAAAPSAAGSVALYDPQRPYHAANLRLAQLVQRNVLASLSADGTAVPDLGVHNDVGYGDLAAAGARGLADAADQVARLAFGDERLAVMARGTIEQ